MEIVFILTEPAVPENIGAAARAIKTMGFNQLRLVKPANHLANESRWLAHGSNDILENALLFNTLYEALEDIDFSMATTAKRRASKFEYYTPDEAKKILEIKEDAVLKAAIVFGREESGLTNREISLCDIAITIPLKVSYPSINLAQSVMLCSYVFSTVDKNKAISINKTNHYPLLMQKVEKLFVNIGIKNGTNLSGRIKERLAKLSATDINLLLSVLNKLEKTGD
jgi:tRNA/rRNA methyltransferase